ncbi:MAG: M48 family metallopeptidase [Aquabacterium sp.]
MSLPPTKLAVDYFDGRSARAHRMQMWIEAGMLQLAGNDLIRQVPLSQVQWPERTRHGARQVHFDDGGSVQALDPGQWDAWYRAQELGESLVVQAQQSWRWTLIASALLVLVTVMGYWWGLPLAARAIAPLIPASVDLQVGRATLAAMDKQWLHPSKLSSAEQARLRQRFDAAMARYQMSRSMPPTSTTAEDTAQAPLALPSSVRLQWHFRRSEIGPNAFALPDGSVVITDELVDLLRDREDVLLGVIGHEIGHILLRHGMRTLIQTGILSAATSVALGDFSSVLAGAPALLGHLAYSRDHEREADDVAIAFTRRNDIRPSTMVVFFERLQAHRAGREAADIGIAFSSHPADAERMARFRAADLGH